MNNFSKIFLTLSLVAYSQAFSMLRITRPLTKSSVIRKKLLKINMKFSTNNAINNTEELKQFAREVHSNILLPWNAAPSNDCGYSNKLKTIEIALLEHQVNELQLIRKALEKLAEKNKNQQ